MFYFTYIKHIIYSAVLFKFDLDEIDKGEVFDKLIQMFPFTWTFRYLRSEYLPDKVYN